MVDEVDDVELLDVVVAPPGDVVVVVVVAELGPVVLGPVVPGPLGMLDVEVAGVVVVDGTEVVEVVGLGMVVELGGFGAWVVGVAGAGMYAHFVLSALHSWRAFELWAGELELGWMLP